MYWIKSTYRSTNIKLYYISFSDHWYRFCSNGLGVLLERRHRINGNFSRWEGLGAQSVPYFTPFKLIFYLETCYTVYLKDLPPSSLLNQRLFSCPESSRRMKNKCNITSTAVASQVKWGWRFKCVSSGLGENAFQDRWKFTIGVIFYVPNTSLAQNSSSPGQWKTCKYYVKNAKNAIFNWYSNRRRYCAG